MAELLQSAAALLAQHEQLQQELRRHVSLLREAPQAQQLPQLLLQLTLPLLPQGPPPRLRPQLQKAMWRPTGVSKRCLRRTKATAASICRKARWLNSGARL